MYYTKDLLEKEMVAKEQSQTFREFLSEKMVLPSAGALFLCWIYLTKIAPTQIIFSSNLKINSAISFLSNHCFAFAMILFVIFLPGVLINKFSGFYNKGLTVFTVVLVACISWEIAKPADKIVILINNFLSQPRITHIQPQKIFVYPKDLSIIAFSDIRETTQRV